MLSLYQHLFYNVIYIVALGNHILFILNPNKTFIIEKINIV